MFIKDQSINQCDDWYSDHDEAWGTTSDRWRRTLNPHKRIFAKPNRSETRYI